MDKMKLLVVTVLACVSVLAAELPVRQITLYKHGVGYFERAGNLASGESAQLDFKASEMNDVLKSLVIRDASGGHITGLRYDSSEPMERKLGAYPFSLEGDVMSLAVFLNQLKGSAVEVAFGNDVMKGTIVSARYVLGDDKRPEREYLVLLLDSGDLRTVDLGSASSVRFPDPVLQAQFRDYLRTLASGRAREKRSVYVDSATDRARQLSVSYMIPAPVWKSSYRLLLKDSGPTIEGWAIVDNTTGEDWNRVTLSLVSGRPISFISSLYEPKYVARAVAELPEDKAQGPIVHEGVVGGVAGGKPGGVIGGLARRDRATMAAPAPPMAQMRADYDSISAKEESRVLAESSVLPAIQAGETGDLFEYRFNEPVVVKKGESAMIPFLQQKISARKLLIYTSSNPLHPMNAAEIKNDTGKTLDGGPITVFDAGTYAGEGLIETLKAGDQRLISYAVDLGTRVSTAFDRSSAIVREVRANRGVLTIRNAARELRTYTVKNVDAKPKTLLIEHPVRQGFKLVDAKPLETTANFYRFEVKLGAGGEARFPVAEEREFESTVAVVNLTPDVLLTYIQNKAISVEGRKQLEQIANLKRQISTADGEIARTTEQTNQLFRDQERLRQNVNSLNSVSGQQEQVRKYAAAMASQEAQLASLRDKRNELDQRRAALQAELNTIVENLQF